MKIIERLIEAIRQAGHYNKDAQVAPACILWPDKDRQWEPLIPRLLMELPELLVYGDYDPSKRTGPAIWLKYTIANQNIAAPIAPPKNHFIFIPIIYLPGIEMQNLQPNEQCPAPLKPLVELQFRGETWTQPNGRDWTVYTFLTNYPGGPNLDIADNPKTIRAMLRNLDYLSEESIEPLLKKHLDSHYFNELSMGGDWQRNLLQFLDNNEKYRSTRGETEWQSFVETCKNQVSFDPDNDAVTEGITHLANQATPPWRTVWNRFSESHRNYPNIPAQIRKIPYTPNANANSVSDNHGWPQWHENQENTLREELKKIEQLTLHDANNTLAKLNETHKKRRAGVWSQLGESPLAHAVETLAKMIDTIIDTPNTGDLHDIENAYSERGWEIDEALIHTLTYLEKHEDIAVVTSILTAFYLPWADNMARRLQDLVNRTGYPRPSYRHENPPQYNPGECILFIDGLRFDQAKKLSQRLTFEQYQVAEHMAWTPLPTVTATCKPALSPIGRHFKGPGTTSTFEPTSAADSQAIYTTQQFHNRLNQAGWEVIPADQSGDIKGNAWTEYGDTDKRGHNSGWKLAKELDRMSDEILARIKQLADAGWKKIHVITDHGWLLFPGGLPKSELPKILTATQWGRCALIKPGARCAEQLFPWYWNPDITIAMAQGVHCYKKSVEYTHGGLSFQECLTLQLIVTPSTPPVSQIEIANITWKKLRCNVTITVAGNGPNPSVDIRTKANDPHTSIVFSIKTFNEDGFASVVVEDESQEGKEAFLIISDEKRQVLNQVPVIIGGGTL